MRVNGGKILVSGFLFLGIVAFGRNAQGNHQPKPLEEKTPTLLSLNLADATTGGHVDVWPAAFNPSSTNDVEQLGNVNFPNSCSADAQAPLRKGLALLHSFQYMASEEAFSSAAKADAKCAMAYWGKAMALYHQLWDFPQHGTLQRGRADITEVQKIGAPTPRERAYIAAAAAFYQDDANLSHAQRVQAYSAALGKLRAEAPEDVEASAFYALSLVALAEEDVDDAENRRAAIDLLTPLLREHPDNPGVAHYLIHAADKPQFATQGLAAARRYAQIAPDSSHALHMPSHIFTRLGLWQESIHSNIAAIASAAHASEMHQSESHYETHAMDFLDYAYLQTGQEAMARKLSEDEMHVPGADTNQIAMDRAMVDARNVLELHRWKEAAGLAVPDVHKRSQDATYWARAIGAARCGDVAGARDAVQKLREAVAARESESRNTGYKLSGEKATDLSEAEAWLAYATGDAERAVAEMRAAADRADAKGSDSITMPAREMLGDLLMQLKRPAEALEAYKLALANAPNRFDALLGAARASGEMRDAKMEHEYFAKLLNNAPECDRAELMEARKYLAGSTAARAR